MYTPEEIDTLNIDQLKGGFFSLMADVVMAYGDDQPLPISCPGETAETISLPADEGKELVQFSKGVQG